MEELPAIECVADPTTESGCAPDTRPLGDDFSNAKGTAKEGSPNETTKKKKKSKCTTCSGGGDSGSSAPSAAPSTPEVASMAGQPAGLFTMGPEFAGMVQQIAGEPSDFLKALRGGEYLNRYLPPTQMPMGDLRTIIGMSNGLGSKWTDILVNETEHSPKLRADLLALEAKGWTIAETSGTSNSNTGTKTIYLNPADATSDPWTLSHEIGHEANGVKFNPSTVPFDGLTKQQWVDKALPGLLADKEGRTILYQYQIRDDLAANGGVDPGSPGPSFDKVYADLKAGKITPDQAAAQFGALYGALSPEETATYKAALGSWWDMKNSP